MSKFEWVEHRKTQQLVSSNRIPVPKEYYRPNKCVTLEADVMCVVTYPRKIKFKTAAFIPKRTTRHFLWTENLNQ